MLRHGVSALDRGFRLPRSAGPPAPHDRGDGRLSPARLPGRSGAKAAAEETKTIPIVVGRAEGDLVAAAGGNNTGSQLLSDELVAKRLELLKALVPNLSRVALLREDVTTSAIPEIPARYDQRAADAGRALGLEVQPYVVRGSKDLAAAFREIVKNQVRAALVASSTFMFVHRQAIVGLAITHRIATVYELQGFVENGGLMSYGVDVPEMERRAASYVNRILRGARPSDLPIEQPTKFDLVVNLKTAKAIGLTVPRSLLIQADQVIE
jgi:putative ABC transport system substrate-binding protein